VRTTRNLCDHQDMMTLTTGTATKRASTGTTTDASEVDSDKWRVFINHMVTTTSIAPTHRPVHDRMRNHF